MKTIPLMLASLLVVPPICGTAEDDCHPSLANCTDTAPGAYKCKCVTGYIGDGKQCARK